MELTDAVAVLAEFLDAGTLTETIAGLEGRLEGLSGPQAEKAGTEAGFTGELLAVALTVSAAFGRINDVIHAAAIVQALPQILEPGERIANRPSLAAGNDPSRPFDLQTTARAAEFKLSRWKGADAMRQRQTFKDLVLLAADFDIAKADLYVVGPEPKRFLHTSRSTAGWALSRTPSVAARFAERFGPLTMAIADFTADHAAHVNIVDLREILPSLNS